MKELYFLIEESIEGGFTARCVGNSIFTEGETMQELKNNIKDAVRCHFDAEELPSVIHLHVVRDEIMTFA